MLILVPTPARIVATCLATVGCDVIAQCKVVADVHDVVLQTSWLNADAVGVKLSGVPKLSPDIVTDFAWDQAKFLLAGIKHS